MRRQQLWFVVATGLVLGGPLLACGADAEAPGVPVSVFTRNIYLGSDLNPLITIPTPADVPAVAATLWANIQASDFPSRAQVIADEIVTLSPALVALQEVSLYRRQVPSDYAAGDATPNAQEVVLDFLDTLMTALQARGGTYRIAGVAPNVDAELPVQDAAGALFDLRLTDRDVILAREDVATADFVQNAFTDKLTFTVGGVGGVPLFFTRSSSHLRATVAGASFVFANSHLEIQLLAAVQLAQAGQLVADLSALPGPMVLAGDFNSAPGKNSYPLLAKTFRDSFAQVAGTAAGVTCCQADDLLNETSTASERIDLILTRGSVRAKTVQVIGTDAAVDRTPGGMWPSDHFGVLGNVEIAVP